MRRHGALGTASDLGIHDHGCWLYRGDAELRHAVVEDLSASSQPCRGDRGGAGRRLHGAPRRPEVTTLVTDPETWSAHTRCGASSPRRRGTDPQTVLDLSRLEFIDHHGLLALADHARSFDGGSAGMAIRGAPFWVRRLCQLIDVEL